MDPAFLVCHPGRLRALGQLALPLCGSAASSLPFRCGCHTPTHPALYPICSHHSLYPPGPPRSPRGIPGRSPDRVPTGHEKSVLGNTAWVPRFQRPEPPWTPQEAAVRCFYPCVSICGLRGTQGSPDTLFESCLESCQKQQKSLDPCH